MNEINTHSKKSSTIRLQQKTKNMLNQLAKGKETHDEIILRLIKMAKNLNSEKNTAIIQKRNIVGTKYQRTHKTHHFKLNGKEYLVVCKYNDLSIISLMRNKTLQQFSNSKQNDWRLDVEIVNVNKGSGWKYQDSLSKKEIKTLYLVCVKEILEDTFDIKLYQFTDIQDYFNIENWIEAYDENNLSHDSLNFDIKRQLA